MWLKIINLEQSLFPRMETVVGALSPKEEKLILTEKIGQTKQAKQAVLALKAGDEVEGEISGVTNFGAFLKFGPDIEGLIPAESLGKAKDPLSILKIGDKIKAEVIKIEGERIYLSPKLKKQWKR